MSHLTTLIDRYRRKSGSMISRHIINMIEFYIFPPDDTEINTFEIEEVGRCINEYNNKQLIDIWNRRNIIREYVRADDKYMSQFFTELRDIETILSLQDQENERPQERTKIRLDFNK